MAIGRRRAILAIDADRHHGTGFPFGTGSQPCDGSVAAAVFAQLSRPAAPYAHQGSGFGLRH